MRKVEVRLDWGLLLMDREFRRRGLDPAGITPLDRLAWVGTRAGGADHPG